MPTSLPAMAPIAKDGMNRPAGTFMPNVNIVINNLNIKAKTNFHMAFFMSLFMVGVES